MKLPSLLPAIERDMEAGQAVVVQLVSTAEACLTGGSPISVRRNGRRSRLTSAPVNM
jgi:hypothetical protein